MMRYPFLRDLLFRFPTEDVHYFSMGLLNAGCSIGSIRLALEKKYTVDSRLMLRSHFGLTFRNPVGLGAGFDKNAQYLKALDTLGFGFIEIGTVTPKAQAGNEKPRLFRLPADKALINRMGFNNDGVEPVRRRLVEWNNTKGQGSHERLVVGGNIGKNKDTTNDDAWKDYCTCFDGLFAEVDYFVVNVSSPNTPGLRELQEKDALKKILSELQHRNHSRSQPKPLLLKISPDLTHRQLDDIIALSFEIRLSGLVATNTTTDRSQLNTTAAGLAAIGAGGLSGRPLQQRATQVLAYISQQTNGAIPIIASGGIFTGADAKDRLDAGAALIQVWTGFIYEGPEIVKNICNHLAQG